jgi:hypothetical protein
MRRERVPLASNENAPAASCDGCADCLHPVALLLRRVIPKLGKIYFEQKLAVFGDILGRELHQLIYLTKEFAPFCHSNQPVLLVVFGNVAVNPLPVSNVQKLADKVMRPVEACHEARRTKEMHVLDCREEF